MFLTSPPPAASDDPVALYAVDPAGGGRAVTRRDLAERLDRATAALRRLGVRPGDRVALRLPLIPEAVVALLACARIGAVATTIGPSATPYHDPADELARRRLRRVRLLVTTEDQVPDASPASPPVLVVRTDGGGPVRRPGDGWSWWHRALAVAPAGRERPRPAGPGTEEHAAALRLGLRGPADVHWFATDLDRLVRHPLAVTGPLALGAAQVLCADPALAGDPDRLRETLLTYRVTVLHAHPDALHEVLSHSPAPELRLAAPLPGLTDAPAPHHWYWQRDEPSSPWQLRHGPNPWSPAARTPGAGCATGM
ncbi:AMP-binding protein [Kitasatospora sp. NPDC004240]